MLSSYPNHPSPDGRFVTFFGTWVPFRWHLGGTPKNVVVALVSL